MRWSDQLDSELMRVRALVVLILLGMLFLGGSLWRIQVCRSTLYEGKIERQSMRRVRLPAPRGEILDRNGVCLADNRPSYALVLYVEELRKAGRMTRTVEEIERVIGRLSAITGLPGDVPPDRIWAHIRRRLPLPFMIWRDIGPEAMARWAERGEDLPGVDLYVEPVRRYPMGPLAAHMLGYVGRWDPEQDEESPYHFYIPDMEGHTGVEQTFNDWLSGVAGGRLIRVDASGFKHHERHERMPVTGRPLHLTIDFRMQRLLEESLAGERGGAVLLDPRNGDVLGMASAPGFDPNAFGPGMTRADMEALNSDTNQPLFNRCISGTYAPGSTFKPVVGLAAMESGIVSEHTVYECPGYYDVGSTRFRCWHAAGHGPLEMRKSLEQSCNAYFCQAAVACGHERVVDMAREFGLGARAGIELRGESAGLVPDDAWKRSRYRDGWRPGDTCNLSIGQGALEATPLQMAVVAAALANGGEVYRPRLVYRASQPGELVRRMSWSAASLRAVRGGMLDVVQERTGTGRRAQVPGVRMAGKTGTAEHGPRRARRKYTWMIAFAPFENPRYALALVVEDGDSGGLTAAPRVSRIFQGLFTLDGVPALPGEGHSS